MSDKKTNNRVELTKEASELLEQYNSQAENDNVHFSHIDGYYGDYSDCCSC